MFIINFKQKVYRKFHFYKNYLLHILYLYLENLVALLFLIIRKKTNAKDLNKSTILICRHFFYGNNEISMEKINLDDTLNNFDVNLIHFYWDIKTKAGTNLLRLIKIILNFKPKLIIFSSYNSTIKRPITQPSRFILNLLSKKLILNNIIAIWWDTCSDSFVNLYLSKKTAFKMHVIVDNPTLNLNYNFINIEEKNKIIALFVPYNINQQFYPLIKSINYSFVGQIDSYRNYRLPYIEHLKMSDIQGEILFNTRDKQISHKSYREILGKSKIGINFSFSVDKDQLKARVFEIIMSGALLLESKNEQTSTILENNIDFVSFDSKEDLLSKIQYYLNNNSEREAIIKNAQKKVLLKYNGLKFWEIIFNKLNLKISTK